MLIGIDIGTTHCKVGAFHPHGEMLHFVEQDMPLRRLTDGMAVFDPETLWGLVQGLLSETLAAVGEPVQAIGVASMAETGMLVDRESGAERTPLLPWFERMADAQAIAVGVMGDAAGLTRRGLRPSFKFPLMKLLWLKERDPALLDGAVWLSAADTIAFRLTGEIGTDFSLASRTFALDLASGDWDREWLAQLSLPEDIFPAIVRYTDIANGPSAVGLTRRACWAGAPEGVPVVIAGHDHVCGAYAAHRIGLDDAIRSQSGTMFNSIGTAESVVGDFLARPLTQEDARSGFAFGRHILPDTMYWMGGLSTSGGLVEWLRRTLNDPSLSYNGFMQLLAAVEDAPTGILCYPYLNGAGSPHSNPQARAAWVGLAFEHSRGHLGRAALEGLAFETELMRRKAEPLIGRSVRRILAAGGGSLNPTWMQIKTDVTGCRVDAIEQAQTTLLGAALLAGETLRSEDNYPTGGLNIGLRAFHPDSGRHAQYQEIYARWLKGLEVITTL